MPRGGATQRSGASGGRRPGGVGPRVASGAVLAFASLVTFSLWAGLGLASGATAGVSALAAVALTAPKNLKTKISILRK